MTVISSSAIQPARSATSGRWVRWIGIGAHALAAYWARRAAIKALRELDDRALHDIGLQRSQIESAVGGAFNPDMGRMR